MKAKISAKHQWTPEKLKGKSLSDLENLRAKALQFGADDLIRMCDAEIQTQAAAKKVKIVSVKAPSSGVVIGYHFVCASNRGVADAGPGRFTSGSWIVSERRVQESLKHGAYLALHETKADASYRQGRIIGYEKTLRDMINRDNWGIEFLVEADSSPKEWVGDGAGEKGYKWSNALKPNVGDKWE